MTKLTLRITKIADQDLDDLYTEGFTTWGETQADRYYDGLLDRFDRICEHPTMYPPLIISGKDTNDRQHHDLSGDRACFGVQKLGEQGQVKERNLWIQ